jgi:hypothetical protein
VSVGETSARIESDNQLMRERVLIKYVNMLLTPLRSKGICARPMGQGEAKVEQIVAFAHTREIILIRFYCADLI